VPTTSSRNPPTRRRGAILLAALATALGLFLLRDRLSPKRAPSEDALLDAAPARTRPSALSPFPFAAPSAAALPAHDDGGEPSKRAIAEKRLERARHTLEGYLLGTRYPPGSRPLSEQPDLQKPHAVQPSNQPLAREDRKLTDARVTLNQDRLYVVGDEVARLSVACATSEGPAHCEVTRAMAHVAESMKNAPAIAPTPVAFAPDPAIEGAVFALFSPSDAGFGGYHGPIGIDLALRVEGEEGGARFDVVYTPAPPARFTGAVREAFDDGSLCLYLGMQVDKPGRYVVVGRVDDADGDGFAYLEHNDMLAAGAVEVKMCIFGKLVLDEQAKSPFVLRDVEGFLLKENTYPDREIVPGRDGPVYTTKAYDASLFSDAEWQSEEKQRHVDEFTKDVEEANAALDAEP